MLTTIVFLFALLSSLFLVIGVLVNTLDRLNRSLYKTELFNHKTQYSKADILGSKYVFIWQSNK